MKDDFFQNDALLKSSDTRLNISSELPSLRKIDSTIFYIKNKLKDGVIEYTTISDFINQIQKCKDLLNNNNNHYLQQISTTKIFSLKSEIIEVQDKIFEICSVVDIRTSFSLDDKGLISNKPPDEFNIPVDLLKEIIKYLDLKNKIKARKISTLFKSVIDKTYVIDKYIKVENLIIQTEMLQINEGLDLGILIKSIILAKEQANPVTKNSYKLDPDIFNKIILKLLEHSKIEKYQSKFRVKQNAGNEIDIHNNSYRCALI